MCMCIICAHQSSCLFMCGFPYIRDVVRNTQMLVCLYFSLVCIHLHLCSATSEVVSGCRQEESRQSRWSIYKGKHGFCAPPTDPSGQHSRHDPSIYTRARGEAAGGGGGQERGKRRGCMGRSCYTCQGGWLGQATGGFCSKSDRLTSQSPLHEADTELANLVQVCVRRVKEEGVYGCI